MERFKLPSGSGDNMASKWFLVHFMLLFVAFLTGFGDIYNQRMRICLNSIDVVNVNNVRYVICCNIYPALCSRVGFVTEQQLDHIFLSVQRCEMQSSPLVLTYQAKLRYYHLSANFTHLIILIFTT